MSRGAYTLRFDRSLDREVVRLVRSQTNRARRELKKPSDGAVHAARKALKRARAALRLVRGVLPRERYRSFDHELRGLGRLLAPVRDAVVALELVATLDEKRGVQDSTVEHLRSWLETAHARAWQDLDDSVVTAIRARLDDLRLAPGELSGLDAGAFYDGLAWTYRRGRKRLAHAALSPDADAFHTWRRQVKHLGYQLRLVAPAWPLVLQPSARALDALGDALGDEHDLAELNRVAKLAQLSPASLRELARWTKEHREAIHARVWPLGARIYAESPKAFATRMTSYISVATEEAEGESLHAILAGLRPPAPERPLAQVPD